MVVAGANLYLTPQVSGDAGVDTLIPLPLQGKDNPILQHLLPTLLSPAVLGEFMPTPRNPSFPKFDLALFGAFCSWSLISQL